MLQASVEQFESIPKFIEKGGKVIIDSVYSFEVSAWLVTCGTYPATELFLVHLQDAKKAYERLESGRSVGKVIINVKDTHSLSSGHAPSVAYLGPEGSYSHQVS
jgi:threonine dehydrogenase-like Zn-dependent dehydrogenase